MFFFNSIFFLGGRGTQIIDLQSSYYDSKCMEGFEFFPSCHVVIGGDDMPSWGQPWRA